MNKKYILIGSLCAVLAVCAVAAVSADPSPASTPLYTLRMEQHSSELNFLPTEVNDFTYTTGDGFTLNCDVSTTCCTDVQPLSTAPGGTFCFTCPPECDTSEWTCHGNYTCYYTCEGHGYTCDQTSCQETCSTCEGWTCDATGCQSTCSTCDQPTCPDTCWDTCDDPTCPYTCEHTCRYTCDKPCQP